MLHCNLTVANKLTTEIRPSCSSSFLGSQQSYQQPLTDGLFHAKPSAADKSSRQGRPPATHFILAGPQPLEMTSKWGHRDVRAGPSRRPRTSVKASDLKCRECMRAHVCAWASESDPYASDSELATLPGWHARRCDELAFGR